MSSSLSPRSSRSCWACSGSPSRLASGLPVAARESDRLSDVSEAARCSFAGSVCARMSASMAPSRARLTSRSVGLSRSWRASARSSSARRVRGSWASAPFESSSSASASSRSAWRSAASATCRCCAMTRSCGFGMTITGTSRSAAMAMATAGRWARRGLNRPAGAIRIARSASARWRLTNRSASPPSVRSDAIEALVSGSVGPADAGNAAASSSALETRSPRWPSPSSARAVSPIPGRARTMATSHARIPTAGMTAAATGIQVTAMKRATVHSVSSATRMAAMAIHVLRTIRRTHRRWRNGRSPARTAIRTGSSGPSMTRRGSAGTTTGASASSVDRWNGWVGLRIYPASVLTTVGEPRRRRQRRVGETNWTDRTRKMTERTDHATTVFPQMDSPVEPKATTS